MFAGRKYKPDCIFLRSQSFPQNSSEYLLAFENNRKMEVGKVLPFFFLRSKHVYGLFDGVFGFLSPVAT